MKWVPTLILLGVFALLLSLKPPAAVQAAALASHPAEPQSAGMQPDHGAGQKAAPTAAKGGAPVAAATPAASPQHSAHEQEVVPALLIIPQAPRNADSVTGYVTAQGGRGQGQMKVALIAADGKQVATTTSGADGRYTFDHVAPGAYKVVANDPDFLYTTAEAASVTAEKGKAAEANIVMSRGGARIAGSVVDANQKAIADQKINLSAGGATISVNTDSKGRFLVNGLVDGTWTVVPDGMPQLSRTVKTNGVDTPEVAIALLKRASLTIRVIGTHLHPLAIKGKEKALLRQAGKSDAAGTLTTEVALVDKQDGKELERDERYGRVVFADLAPGAWELEIVDAKGNSLLTGAAPWETPTPITLEAGQERDWPLPTFNAARGLGVEVPLGVIIFMIVAIGLLIFATPVLFPPPLTPKKPAMAPAAAATPAAPAVATPAAAAAPAAH
jgi:hypothetical protein